MHFESEQWQVGGNVVNLEPLANVSRLLRVRDAGLCIGWETLTCGCRAKDRRTG